MSKKEDKFYQINSLNIWEYESELFREKKTSLDFFERIDLAIGFVLINGGDYVFDLDEYNNVTNKSPELIKKYNRVLELYNNGTDYENYLLSPYVHDGTKFYSYDQSIFINSGLEDFNLFFALKLRQFDEYLFEIEPYLNYHLASSFDDNVKSMIKFLTLVIRQYEQSIFTKRIVKTIIDWTENIDVKSDKNPTELKRDSDNETNDSNSLVISKDIWGPVITALEQLFKSNDRQKLKDLIEGKTIDGKINFYGTAKQLKMVFRQLKLNGKIPDDYSDIARWLCNFLTYSKKGAIPNIFKYRNTHQDLTENDFKLSLERRINIKGLEHKIDKYQEN